MTEESLRVPNLGEARYDSPLEIGRWIDDDERVLIDGLIDSAGALRSPLAFENAGPRRKIFFEPARTNAVIVTCGGLCPGLNNVIQSIVRMLLLQYGVRRVYGALYGYEGLIPNAERPLLELTPENVADIHTRGGTILGSSRGHQDPAQMVDFLIANNISILFTIGGDGTMRGAQAIYEEVTRRDLKIAVVAVPKTIDNDICYVYRTFGFTTAVAEATRALSGAHAEAKGAYNGVALVKVMGRDSGFIASYAALASSEVNICLIPEAPFRLHGAGGLLDRLHERLQAKHHAVLLVAEGAGQEYATRPGEVDASGNVKHGDIGLFLKDAIVAHFRTINFPITLKYIDPSYLIRSAPASPEDAVFCIMLAQNAVHAAMAGKTGCLVGFWNSYFTFTPLSLVSGKRRKVEPDGYLWSMVRESTGQPDLR